MKSLNKVNFISKKSNERAEAAGLIKAIHNFEFVILTIMQEKLLTSVDLVSQFLQRKDSNLFEATTLLEATLLGVKNYRNNFEEAKKSAETLAKSWGTKAAFRKKRQSRKEKHFGEI